MAVSKGIASPNSSQMVLLFLAFESLHHTMFVSLTGTQSSSLNGQNKYLLAPIPRVILGSQAVYLQRWRWLANCCSSSLLGAGWSMWPLWAWSSFTLWGLMGSSQRTAVILLSLLFMIEWTTINISIVKTSWRYNQNTTSIVLMSINHQSMFLLSPLWYNTYVFGVNRTSTKNLQLQLHNYDERVQIQVFMKMCRYRCSI